MDVVKSLVVYMLLIITNCCPSILTSKRKESSTSNRDCFNGDTALAAIKQAWDRWTAARHDSYDYDSCMSLVGNIYSHFS